MMEKQEFDFQKKLEETRHKNHLKELELRHTNKMLEISAEKRSRVDVDKVFHENKMAFHRLKRADERRRATGNWEPRP